MTTMQAQTLKVPGASLYYEVRGTGPVLLCIPGGPTDASVFSEMAGLLSDRYTVVTYDPRGHSRSTLDGPPSGTVEVHADDAARLIEAVGGGPAFVLGSSGGGTIGLDLVARHGSKVAALVAHEPPVMELLPDADRWRKTFRDIVQTHAAEGAMAAMAVFGAAVEEGGPSYEQPQGDPPPAMAEMMRRMMDNAEFFFAHEILSIGGYSPDVDALQAAPSRIVVAGGRDSGQQGAYRAAVALAGRLGIDVMYFDGAHGGMGASEESFAERLHEVLRSTT